MFPWPPPDPHTLLNKLQDEMRGAVDRLWHTGVSTRPLDGQEWAPSIDVYEFPDHYRVYLEVAGVNPNEIDVSYVGSTVTIRGRKDAPVESGEQVHAVRTERRFGAFNRGIELAGGVNIERTTAKCQAGVLELTIPKSEANRPKTVKINLSDA